MTDDRPEYEKEGSLAFMLDSIFALEDNEPRKGTKAHKEWKDKLIKQLKAFNEKIGREAFKTHF